MGGEMRATLFSVVLIFLFCIGCGQPGKKVIYPGDDTPTKVVVETPPTDPCEDVTCSENEFCRGGKCLCNRGYKECEDRCIPMDACCADRDCQEGLICRNSECVERCDLLKCESNKICDDNNECGCEFGDEWCEHQGKCIQANFCCTGADCKGAKDCVYSGRALDFCFESRETDELLCNRVTEQSFKTLEMEGNDYRVTALKILKGDVAYVQVDDRLFKQLKPDTKYSFDDKLRFYISSIRTYGGACEEEDD